MLEKATQLMRSLEFSGFAKEKVSVVPPFTTRHLCLPNNSEANLWSIPLRAAAFAILPTRGGSLTSPTWRRCRLTLKSGLLQSLLPWN